MTTWNGRPYPNFTETNWDGNVYWDADLRWDGITLIDPNWQGRDEVITNWTDGNTKLEYSPNNATWTDIVNLTTAGSVSFPILMKKGYYYRVNATSNIAGIANTASINYIQ